jgi:phosphate transport system substrate-binding protein
MVIAVTDQEAAEEAERLPGSLAVNTLALVLSERRKVTVIAVDGAVPSVQALATGSYPYFKRLVIVTRGAPSGTLLQFIEFLRSPKGRAILEANGHFVAY